MISFFHNSRDEKFRTPCKAVPSGTAVCVYLEAYDERLSDASVFRRADLRLNAQYVPEKGQTAQIENTAIPLETVFFGQIDTENGIRTKYVFKAEIPNEKAGVVFYRFELETYSGDVFVYGNNENALGGIGKTYYPEENTVCDYQITVYKNDLSVPEWFRKSIIYQIFPDRFYRGHDFMSSYKPDTFVYGNWDDMPMYVKKPDGDIARWDFFGGNLMGVSEKLEYIENIGANLIYLNPVFEASSNHRYDTADYMRVDSLLGGDDAFDVMINAGKKRGIRFMLDGVFSHTGNDSKYFDACGKYGGGAYRNPDSQYREWYRFGENDDEYECWWGCKALPNVEELCPSYLDYIVKNENSVIRHWIKKGAMGWRLDVANELPDEFIRELRNAAETSEKSDINTEGDTPVVLGEVWEDATNKVSYGMLRRYFTDSELHTVTNYLFRKYMLEFFSGEAGATLTRERFLSLEENCPRHNFYSLANMTGSHDVERLMTFMLRICGYENPLLKRPLGTLKLLEYYSDSCDGEEALKRIAQEPSYSEVAEAFGREYAKARQMVGAYAAVQFFFPGVPVVYYGDETCMCGGTDPDNRRTYPWKHQDVSMIDWFSYLAGLRRKNEVLVSGEFKLLKGFTDKEKESVFGLCRYSDDGKTPSFACAVRNVSFDDESGETVYLEGLMPDSEYWILVNGEIREESAPQKVKADSAGTVAVQNCGRFVILKEITR